MIFLHISKDFFVTSISSMEDLLSIISFRIFFLSAETAFSSSVISGINFVSDLVILFVFALSLNSRNASSLPIFISRLNIRDSSACFSGGIEFKDLMISETAFIPPSLSSPSVLAPVVSKVEKIESVKTALSSSLISDSHFIMVLSTTRLTSVLLSASTNPLP